MASSYIDRMSCALMIAFSTLPKPVKCYRLTSCYLCYNYCRFPIKFAQCLSNVDPLVRFSFQTRQTFAVSIVLWSTLSSFGCRCCQPTDRSFIILDCTLTVFLFFAYILLHSKHIQVECLTISKCQQTSKRITHFCERLSDGGIRNS